MANILDYNKALTNYNKPGGQQAYANTVQQFRNMPGNQINQTAQPQAAAASPAAPAASSNPPMIPTQPYNPPNFDQLIAPAIEGYNGYINTLQGQLPGQLSSIDQNLANNTNSLKSNIAGQTQTVNTAKAGQQKNTESAANEAKRIYAEIVQGNQARYGGTTGTGAFASEIAGASTGRDIASIRTTGAQLVQQMDDKLQQIQEIGRVEEQDLNQKAADAKRQAQDSLNQQVASIRSKIGETQANKAQMYASAYSDYQNYVRSVDAQNTQFQQQLYQQQQAAAASVQAARERASGIASSATPEDLTGLLSQAQQITEAGYSPTVNLSSKGAGSLSFTTPQKESGDAIDELIKQSLGQ